MFAALCPACSIALEPGRFGGAEVLMCPECMGTLVAQRFLVPLLSDLAKGMASSIAFDHPIDPLPDSRVETTCPNCQKGMERFGYMGTQLVQAARCADCWVVWGTCDEISVMSVLWARTNFRSEHLQSERDEAQESLNRRVAALLRARARADRLANNPILG